jgi:hypothetical protein
MTDKDWQDELLDRAEKIIAYFPKNKFEHTCLVSFRAGGKEDTSNVIISFMPERPGYSSRALPSVFGKNKSDLLIGGPDHEYVTSGLGNDYIYGYKGYNEFAFLQNDFDIAMGGSEWDRFLVKDGHPLIHTGHDTVSDDIKIDARNKNKTPQATIIVNNRDEIYIVNRPKNETIKNDKTDHFTRAHFIFRPEEMIYAKAYGFDVHKDHIIIMANNDQEAKEKFKQMRLQKLSTGNLVLTVGPGQKLEIMDPDQPSFCKKCLNLSYVTPDMDLSSFRGMINQNANDIMKKCKPIPLQGLSCQ